MGGGTYMFVLRDGYLEGSLKYKRSFSIDTSIYILY
jgi:hypothetical protein